MFRFISELLTDFLELIYPTLCIGCNKTLEGEETLLCVHCRMQMPETNSHRLNESELIYKFAGRVKIEHVAAFYRFTKGSVVQKLIHAMKYKDQPEAAMVVGSWYGYRLRTECPWLDEIDALIAVPIHKRRLRKRGYNQANQVAEGLSTMTALPFYTDTMVRKRFQGSQTHKNRLQRWLNVQTVFAVVRPEMIAGKHIAIVDDVLTTGATIESCAIELHRAGCRSISVLTIAATR